LLTRVFRKRIKICPASIGKSDEGIHNNPHNPPCEIRDNQRKIFSPTKEYTTIHVFSISPPIVINIKSNKGTHNNPPCEIRNHQRKIPPRRKNTQRWRKTEMIHHSNKTITFEKKKREREKTDFITAPYGGLPEKKK
jgi:hypothetical protein